MSALLEVKNLNKTYGDTNNLFYALKNVSFSVEKGEFVVLLGPSGCGKSTLLNILGIIDQFDDGEILIDGDNLRNFSEAKATLYRRKHLGFVFQNYNLVPNLTVRENIMLSAFLTKDSLDVDAIIESLGLTDVKENFPRQLSGGQQQRVSIGRAFAKKPDLILADEPTGALDYKSGKEVLSIFEKLNREYHTTILMVTHNTALKEMADRVITLKDGVIISDVKNLNKKDVEEIEW